jgi:hypothetical protein
MKTNYLRFLIIVIVFAVLIPISVSAGDTRILHGADSSFRSNALGICWGILKSQTSDTLQVVIRIQILDSGSNSFRSFAVKAIHPFTGESEEIAARQPLRIHNDVITPREDFKRLGGRQVLFFQSTTGPEDQIPDLIVEYLGIPDTTPEFSDSDKLESYFTIAFERLQKL